MIQKKIISRKYLKFDVYITSCVHFFEWFEKSNYFYIGRTNYWDGNDGGMDLYKTLTGEYDFGDGCTYIKVSKPFTLGIFSANFAWRFVEYVKEKHVSQHIPLKKNFWIDKCWFVIDKFEPEKWLMEFFLMEIKKQEKFAKANAKPVQMKLF